MAGLRAGAQGLRGEKMPEIKIYTQDIEIAVAKLFGYRSHLIVPNISWGLDFKHELDLLILTPANQ